MCFVIQGSQVSIASSTEISLSYMLPLCFDHVSESMEYSAVLLDTVAI